MPVGWLWAQMQVGEYSDLPVAGYVDIDDVGCLVREVQREPRSYYRRAMRDRPLREKGVLRPLEAGWLGRDRWLGMAERLGPLSYSQLGDRSLQAPSQVRDVAEWLGDKMDSWWHADNRPDPWTVAVVSGDDGSLAKALIDLEPACSKALRYVVVEPTATDGVAARARVGAKVALEEPETLFPLSDALMADGSRSFPRGRGMFDSLDQRDEETSLAQGVGPLVTWTRDIPVLSGTCAGPDGDASGAIVAIGVLGAEAFDLYVAEEVEGEDNEPGIASPECWREVRIAAAEGAPRSLRDITVPPPPGGLPVELTGVDSSRGDAVVVPVGAAQWLRDALRLAPKGRLVAVEEWSHGSVHLDSGRANRLGGYWLTPSRAVSLSALAAVCPPESPSGVPVAGNLRAVTWSTA